MKKTFRILCMVLMMAMMSSSTLHAQGIHFTEGKWNSILSQAKQQDKLIFIDVYTSWCGPCKKMAREAFPDKEVGDFFNSHFINYSIDAEKGEGIDIAKKYDVTAFPTCMFINGNGEAVYRFMGAKSAKQLLKEGQKAEEVKPLFPQLKKMEADYKKGKRDKTFLKQFVDLKMKLGLEPQQALTQYLIQLSEDELFSEDNLKKIEKVDTYDKSLFHRFGLHYAAAPEAEKKKLETPIMKAIGGCLVPMMNAGKKEDAETYEELLRIKENMKVDSNPIKQIFGGGPAYINSDHLRFSYYQQAHLDKKYVALADEYMKTHYHPLTADSMYIDTQNSRKEILEKVNALKASGDSTALKKELEALNLRGMIMLMSGLQTDAGFMVSIADRYWQLSDKSPAVREKVKRWAEAGYKTAPSLSTADKYTDLLITLGEKDKAKQILQQEIDYAKVDPTAKESTAADIEKAEQKIKNL
ncbi:MAG: thioredoxin family protein [Prevotella sp.]|nr:thioredoxin family protein [Prevotella sp.]